MKFWIGHIFHVLVLFRGAVSNDVFYDMPTQIKYTAVVPKGGIQFTVAKIELFGKLIDMI